MSVLASQVISRINTLFSDTSNGKWNEAEKLEAVNAAIDGAWPHIRALAEDTSQTIAAGTYAYTPSATPEVEYGFAQAYARLDGYPDTLLRRASQSQSGSAFTVYLTPQDSYDYSDYTLRLVYTARLPRVTATSDSIELPLDYLFKAAAVWLMTNKVLAAPKADVEAYEKMLVKFERDVQAALAQNQRGLVAHLIPRATDASGGTVRQFEPGTVTL